MKVAVLQPRDIIPPLGALRNHFEAIRRAELTRLERTRLDDHHETLLLTPTEHLKSVSDGPMRVRYADVLTRLCRLAAEDDDKVEPPSEDPKTTVSTP